MNISIVKCNSMEKEWLFELHVKTLKEYITRVYGWNEEGQKKYFNDASKMNNYYLIRKDGRKAGAINYYENEFITINRIGILPEYQNQGIGTSVMNKTIKEVQLKSRDFKLRVFKINPAKFFYEKLGFKITNETDTHFYMVYNKKERMSWV